MLANLIFVVLAAIFFGYLLKSDLFDKEEDYVVRALLVLSLFIAVLCITIILFAIFAQNFISP